MKKIAVIGAGAWGTTLSVLLAEAGNEVILWAFEKEVADEIAKTRENKTFLPGFQVPENITVTIDPGETKSADLFFLVVPTQFLRGTAKKFKPVINQDKIVVCASKGIELNTQKLPLQILQDELTAQSLAVLSGPNLSTEIAKGLPAASVVAAKDSAICRLIQKTMMLERFRVYTSTDTVGVELGGALKNIIAIAAGVAGGLALGHNALASLMIRGIAEISRLGLVLRASPKTFAGLSGMGDLITTCSSKLSRNYCVGQQIAQGKKLKEILKSTKSVAEGVPTTKAALALAKKYKIELPIAQEVYQVLYEAKSPTASITSLMTRSATNE